MSQRISPPVLNSQIADPSLSLRQRMSRDLPLRSMATRTHDGYLREVRKLAAWFNTAPDRLSQQQVGQYLLYLINDCNFAPGSLREADSALKFFYGTTCPREWDVLSKLRVPKQQVLAKLLGNKQGELG